MNTQKVYKTKKIMTLLILALITLFFLPACFGTTSLKGKTVKKFIVKLGDDSGKICPNNPINLVVKAVLDNGEMISTSSFTGGIAWSDIVVEANGATFMPAFTKGILHPNEQSNLNKTPYLDLNIYSKYHPNQAFKQNIKLSYDCDYKINLQPSKARNGSAGQKGQDGKNGPSVTAKIQLVQVENKPLLQVLVFHQNKQMKYLVDPNYASFNINAEGGEGGDGGHGSDARQDQKGNYLKNGQRGGNGGKGGLGGHVTYIFSPNSIAYKDVFKAEVSRGDGGNGGRGGSGKRDGRDGRDGNAMFVSHTEVRDGKLVNVISTGEGKVHYLTQELPATLW